MSLRARTDFIIIGYETKFDLDKYSYMVIKQRHITDQAVNIDTIIKTEYFSND